MVKKIVYLVVLVFFSHAWASPPLGRHVTNPFEFIKSHYRVYNYGYLRFYHDIDRDGVEDLFLAPRSLMAKTGVKFFSFLNKDQGKRYKYLGEFNLKVDALKFSYDTKGNLMIKTFAALSSKEGVLRTYKISNKDDTVKAVITHIGSKTPLRYFPTSKVTIESISDQSVVTNLANL